MKDQTGKIFFPNLDALRFFSFATVFLAHSFTNEMPLVKAQTWAYAKNCIIMAGESGVSFFFVLSGFLITYLILKEIEQSGRLDIKSFYIRRTLRIWPLYYATVIFGFLIFPILKVKFGQVSNETADPVLSSLFLNNFNNMYNGPPDASVLGFLWSVAIEEQFYLVWPILFVVIPYRYYKHMIIGVIIISFFFRTYFYSYFPIVDIHTIAVVGDMAMGGLGAFMILNSARFKSLIENLPKWFLYVIYILLLVSFCVRPYTLTEPFLMIFKRVLSSFIFIAIILEQNYCSNSLFKAGQLKTISQWGKYSYALYCLHSIGILISINVLGKVSLNKYYWQVWFIELPFSMALCILIGWTSYTFFESRFLKLKNRFAVVKT